MRSVFSVLFLLLITSCFSQVAEYWEAQAGYWSASRDMIRDKNGDIFLTGHGGGSPYYDVVTMKYNSYGYLQWQNIHNDSAFAQAEAKAIALDTIGNIYVTGSESHAGDWNIITIKYDVSGNELWTREYSGNGNSTDEGADIAVSDSGEVYVTGYVTDSASAQDIILIKYNSSGGLEWVKQFNGDYNGNDQGESVVVDHSGNVIISGKLRDSTSVLPLLTAKYDRNGNTAWIKKFYGPYNRGAYCDEMIIDRFNNLYLTGALLTGSWFDILTLKYDSLGNVVWYDGYDSPYNLYDYGHSIKRDSLGNIYVAGQSDGGQPLNFDYIALKYDSSGTRKWASRYDNPGHGGDYGYGVDIDDSGNVYVTGQSYSANGIPCLASVKFDTGGVFKWHVEDPSYGFASKIIVESRDAIYVFGTNDRNTGYSHFTLIKYGQSPVAVPEVIETSVYDANVLPDPVDDHARLIFENAEHKNCRLIIYNSLGNIINDEQHTSSSEFKIEKDNLPGGIYFFRIFSGETVLNQGRFIVK